MFGDIVVPVNLCDLDLFELQKLISGRYQIAPPPSVSQYCGELFPKRILNPIIEVEEEDEENSKSPETLDTPTPIIQNPTIVNLLSFGKSSLTPDPRNQFSIHFPQIQMDSDALRPCAS